MEELTHDFLSFLPAALLALAAVGAPEVYKLAARRFLDRAKSHMASWLYILLDSFLTPVAGLFRVLLGAAAVKSLPFDAYMVMILFAALGVKIPSVVFTLTRPAGQANAFVAMLMIGMMFEPAGDRALLRETARELVWRYLFAAASAALVFFCTPFELVVRQTLCIVCFAPLSSLAPIYTDRCHSDTALASFTNSVSIAVSLIVMLALGLGFVL